MKAEDNLVDSWLKESVKREMYFRVGAWSIFTVLVFYISFKDPSFALINYAFPFIQKELDKLNFVWAFLFYPVLLAFFFKDIKHSKPDKWGGGTVYSNLGMIVKKLTGELLLWVTTQPYEFTRGSIFHLMEPDLNQEIYGLPEYLSAIPSALLNESATLFRRKYYINGSHAGFIMYMTDAAQNQEDVNNIRQAMKNAKGPGNFRNLFMYSPNGKKDGIQIIPLSEVAAKDEFLNIKNVSRDDMMAAHRVPPQMMGIMPSNVGGFGDVEKAANVFVRNELLPLQKRISEVNDWLGEDILRFVSYSLT